MICLKNKVALVTGASRGIGRAIATTFAAQGAKVIVNYSTNEDEAKKTLDLMGEKNNGSFIIGFDVSNEQAVEEALEKIGPVDILVNNAGICIDTLLLRLKEDDFDKQIAINLKGSFICARVFVKGMIKNRWGRIINVSSVVGEMGNAGQSVYAATKAGLIGLTKSLARELASRNILVNAITPGYIETDMTKDISKKVTDAILAQIPLKRMGTPEDVAHAALFLASSHADYITGHVLKVNGGMYL